MRGKYIKMVIPRISEVFQHVLKTHCGMYECMDFIPKFLRWWVTSLAGWRYSFTCQTSVWKPKSFHRAWVENSSVSCSLRQGSMANCIVDTSVNCTLRWRPMENVLNIHHWTAHRGKALWYTNWKFLSNLHIWGKDTGPMRINLWIHQSSAHWRQRFIGHVQWKVSMYRYFTSLKVMGA
jgi:hypothetical protein